MEINSPQELVTAIHNMVLQMNKKQRKSFLMWVKQLRNRYDVNYPEGLLPKEPENAPSTPDLAVPHDAKQSLILPANYQAGKESISTSSEDRSADHVRKDADGKDVR